MPFFLLIAQLFGYSFYLNIVLLSVTVISLLVAFNLTKRQKVYFGKGSIKVIAVLVVFYVGFSWFSAQYQVAQCKDELKLHIKGIPRICFFYQEPQFFVGSETICYAKIILNKEETKKFMDDNKKARLAPPNYGSFNDVPLGKLLGWNPKSGRDVSFGEMTFEGRGFIQYYIDQSHKKKDVLYLMCWIG